MKTLIYTVTGTLKQQGTGPDALVGDQVEMTLDTVLNSNFNESILGVIQHPIVTSECDSVTTYRIEYDPANIGGGITEISQAAVSDILVLSGVDALALVVEDETQARIAADDTLQDNIDAEALARSTADGTLQGNINSEASARSIADGLLVPKTTTVNTKPLSGNIVLDYTDVGAAPASHDHTLADVTDAGTAAAAAVGDFAPAAHEHSESTLNIRGPYANDGAAAAAVPPVAVGDIYRTATGTVAWRQV